MIHGDTLLPTLRSVFPDCHITFGYIGNYEGPDRDYRSWKFFTNIETTAWHGKCQLSVSVLGPQIEPFELKRIFSVLQSHTNADIPISMVRILDLLDR